MMEQTINIVQLIVISSMIKLVKYHYQTFILAITFHFIRINNQNSTVLYSQFFNLMSEEDEGQVRSKGAIFIFMLE